MLGNKNSFPQQFLVEFRKFWDDGGWNLLKGDKSGKMRQFFIFIFNETTFLNSYICIWKWLDQYKKIPLSFGNPNNLHLSRRCLLFP